MIVDPESEIRARRGAHLLIAAHCAVWLAYALIAHSYGDLQHDMTEAWAWGQERWPGYYKHPPFYAWATYAWFQVLPRTDWAFYLLAALNSSLGLAGVWALAGRILTGPARLAAVLLMALTPFYGFFAINFNANTVLLSLWPWAVYALVRAFETGAARWGLIFGALAGAALLSKYYSVLLVASCLAAAILHPNRRRIWRSPAPYVAGLTMAALVAQHGLWLASGAFTPLDYALTKTGSPRLVLLWKVLATTFHCLAFHAVALTALIATFGRTALAAISRAPAELVATGRAWLLALAAGPFLLTLLSGAVGSVKISWNYAIPAFYLMPVAVLAVWPGMITAGHVHRLGRIVGAVLAALLLAAPIVAVATFRMDSNLGNEIREPRRALALEATRLWHEAVGARLSIVAGTNAYGHGMSFYSPDAPSDFTQLNPDFAPWITQERLNREGLLVACRMGDDVCNARARPLLTPASRTLELGLDRDFLGWTSPPVRFTVYLIPPR